jgi:hypothetical protein
MSNSPRRGRSLCIYCGRRAAVTHDHVPPKAIFASPRPANLITVPACHGCNSQASGDDEYFRTMLTLRESAFDHPDARKNVDDVLRALRKPAKRKFTRALLSTLQLRSVRTPAGLYLGKKWSVDVDLTRLGRVISRVVRGLYFHEHGAPLPVSADVSAFCEDGLSDLPPNAMAQVRDSIVRPLYSVKPTTIGNATFEYRHISCREPAHASAWLLQFYADVRFLCITVPSPTAGDDAAPSSRGTLRLGPG